MGGATVTASAGAELIEQRGGAVGQRESLSWQGARLVALVGGASGELPRGHFDSSGGRGSQLGGTSLTATAAGGGRGPRLEEQGSESQ